MPARRQKPKKLTPLELKWEQILEKEGLGDIEHRASGLLRHYDSFRFKTYAPKEFLEKELYYRLARALVHEDVFANAKDRKIWELHANGATVPEILKQVKGIATRTIELRLATYRKYLCT